jgi:hypothetical protein
MQSFQWENNILSHTHQSYVSNKFHFLIRLNFINQRQEKTAMPVKSITIITIGFNPGLKQYGTPITGTLSEKANRAAPRSQNTAAMAEE